MLRRYLVRNYRTSWFKMEESEAYDAVFGKYILKIAHVFYVPPSTRYRTVFFFSPVRYLVPYY